MKYLATLPSPAKLRSLCVTRTSVSVCIRTHWSWCVRVVCHHPFHGVNVTVSPPHPSDPHLTPLEQEAKRKQRIADAEREERARMAPRINNSQGNGAASGHGGDTGRGGRGGATAAPKHGHPHRHTGSSSSSSAGRDLYKQAEEMRLRREAEAAKRDEAVRRRAVPEINPRSAAIAESIGMSSRERLLNGTRSLVGSHKRAAAAAAAAAASESAESGNEPRSTAQRAAATARRRAAMAARSAEGAGAGAGAAHAAAVSAEEEAAKARVAEARRLQREAAQAASVERLYR